MSLVHPTPVTFEGPAGLLEGLYGPPEASGQELAAPRAAAVLCHPHPAHGGTMHNTVVFRVAKGLRRAGLAVLRFNFRGVEGSVGEHHGQGLEEEDAAAALDFMAARHPGLALWAGGFSFGARTICGLAPREPRIERALFIALPVAVYDCDPITTVPQPSLCLFAGNDDFGTQTIFVERFGPPRPNFDVQEILGTDHFFRHKTPELEERVFVWASAQLEQLP
jgi:alpha/beta superfamily hydrolase